MTDLINVFGASASAIVMGAGAVYVLLLTAPGDEDGLEDALKVFDMGMLVGIGAVFGTIVGSGVIALAIAQAVAS